MTDRAEVVIIGGGIVGSSVAYHLAEAGCTHVLIIERAEKQGSRSTARSTGAAPAQLSTPINIQLSLYSTALYSKCEDATGQTPDYRHHGYLFTAPSEPHLAYP